MTHPAEPCICVRDDDGTIAHTNSDCPQAHVHVAIPGPSGSGSNNAPLTADEIDALNADLNSPVLDQMIDAAEEQRQRQLTAARQAHQAGLAPEEVGQRVATSPVQSTTPEGWSQHFDPTTGLPMGWAMSWTVRCDRCGMKGDRVVVSREPVEAQNQLLLEVRLREEGWIVRNPNEVYCPTCAVSQIGRPPNSDPVVRR